ncbi:MAG TPA: AAA family ATPase [Gemmataceae bacterium]|nr:AAA family ATPase [Gemmataceae bacterium]
MPQLKKMRIAGWKSIKDATIKVRPLNVFIGANGAGKSNLVSFFRLVDAVVNARLADFVAKAGGANALLHYGVKATQQMFAELEIVTEAGSGEFGTLLDFGSPDNLIVNPRFGDRPEADSIEINASVDGQIIGRVKYAPGSGNPGSLILDMLSKIRSYQFHDTSNTSPIRLTGYIEDNRELRAEGGNLAAILYKYQQANPLCYRRIVGAIRLIAPFFGDFVLQPRELNPQTILLNWKERASDYLFGPHQLPDGLLRAMALIALLLQPERDFPSVLVIDEPELGLHPFALSSLASLLQKAAHHCQVIVATQSAALLDYFDVEDIVIVDRPHHASEFKRLAKEELTAWLEDYSLSELWEKNVFGGRPAPWLG